ncbi:carbohydrate ABC transporter permease [Sediminispirochaeta bajacaliforniensis]|uniref:carbohydrate ABC transporter permease n=1 Tax=Sediminispirochaeta bajacaliforniensis TaxID=148 RepID=UPI000368C443|nr:carbohydrate ABC transporter permease [Sediminispirochaeta bajacaliforniensis]
MNKHHRIPVSRVICFLILVLFLIIACAPFSLIWSAAFKTKAELVHNVFGPPQQMHWENIAKTWEQGHFGIYYKNSVLVVIPVVLFSIMLSLTNAYAFAYFRFPGKTLLWGIVLFGMTIPMEVVVIQLYHHLKGMGLLNTLPGLILPQIAMGIPFGTFFMRGTLKEIPKSLIEAAEIDGAGTSQVLWKIITPMIGPSVITLIVFFFTWTWNEFLLTLVIISKEALRTLPVGMAFFQGKYVGNTPLIAMGATLMTAPIILLYIFLQHYVISGITAGALKE